MAEEYVSRPEFDDLRREVRTLGALSTSIAVLTNQVATVQRDMGELRQSLQKSLEDHSRQHDEELRQRGQGRRWLVTTGIAALAAMAGLYGWIALLIHHG